MSAKIKAVISVISDFIEFADSERWWDRPLSPREKRHDFAQSEKDLGEIIEFARQALDKDWRDAVESLKKDALKYIENPSGIERLQIPLESFQARLIKAALEAYRQGEREARKELKPALKFAEDGLPDLIGSDKQKQWAAKIRTGIFNALNGRVTELNTKLKDPDYASQDSMILSEILKTEFIKERMKKEEKASWWIDSGKNYISATPSDISIFVGRHIEKISESETGENFRIELNLLHQAREILAKQKADPIKDYEGLLKARAFEVAQGMQDKALGSIKSALEEYALEGLPIPERREKLATLFDGLAAGHLIAPGTPGHDYSKPAIQETTVRTLTADAMNKGRMELYEKNKGYVLGIELSEIAEGREMGRGGRMRSHPLSRWLDGLKIKIDDPRLKQLTGTRHFNDRKVDLPITLIDEPVAWSSDNEINTAISKGHELSPRFF